MVFENCSMNMYDWTDDGTNFEIYFEDGECVGRFQLEDILEAEFRDSIHEIDELASVTLNNGDKYLMHDRMFVLLSKEEKYFLKTL